MPVIRCPTAPPTIADLTEYPWIEFGTPSPDDMPVLLFRETCGRRQTRGGRCANPVTHSSTESHTPTPRPRGTTPRSNCAIFGCR